ARCLASCGCRHRPRRLRPGRSGADQPERRRQPHRRKHRRQRHHRHRRGDRRCRQHGGRRRHQLHQRPSAIQWPWYGSRGGAARKRQFAIAGQVRRPTAAGSTPGAARACRGQRHRL
ncbi:MAG: hypothetical protein AVDCRST_MAG44-539, partial [uncultured Sphingomonas sp.]